MPTIEIDGQKATVEEGLNVLEAAERLGIEIPHYCYHPGLSISGNCRMCLVEIDKMPKLQIACNTRVTDGMVVRTQTDRVRRARRSVLEFLLINHPVDCPVCDQAGECKLQDYYMEYDLQPSRVSLGEKVKKGKAIDIGPLVMLDQERCILCTRCIRFVNEVSKTGELSVVERGDRSRISVFPGNRLENPYSGNLVDICPVGALTNKAFRFRTRVWYLEHTPSVCGGCATGCNIDIHYRGNEIFRFRPRHNEAVNGYWMCDEGRLGFRRYQEGRLLAPEMRDSGTDRAEVSWETAAQGLIDRLREVLSKSGEGSVAGIVSAQATCEEAFLFNRLIREALQGRAAGFSWSPPGAYHDDFLVDADRNPNTAGLQALGLDPSGGEDLLQAVQDGGIKALVLLRCDFSESHGKDFLDSLSRQLDFLAVIDTHHHATIERAALVLPIAGFPETEGTFVNRKGRVQRIRPAVEPPGEARPGWSVLAELCAAAGSGKETATTSEVFAEIAASVPTLGDLTFESVGLLGQPLNETPES